MVCQGASQTTFRSLKHEKGVAGSVTIIVKVIACFQPLQDCQNYGVISFSDSQTFLLVFCWMEEDCGSWFPQQQFGCQSPNLKSLTVPVLTGQQRTALEFMKPKPDMINETLPLYANPSWLHSWAGQMNEPFGWFSCLPRSQPTFEPFSNSIWKEQLPTQLYENHRGSLMPNVGPVCAEKRFLVFDQTRDQTTLIFSSGVGTPVQCPTQKPPGACNFNSEFPKDGLNLQPGPISTDRLDESEMHEDTEELNALLYSADDSDYTEDDDDEVTSTGHSPSTMTGHCQQKCTQLNLEEVCSSAGQIKKRKQLDEIPSLLDTASSDKLNQSVVCEDDAESCCASKQGLNETTYLDGSRKMKKRKLRQTVSVLQSLLPIGKGEDMIVVLDEAISYLKSLRNKAEALGIDSP
ncbi:hypothetical protein ACFE04_008805 [Oxalis oulophora]